MAVVQTVSRLFLSHSRGSCTSRILPVISMKHASTATTYQFILTEKCGEKKNVGLIKLNRPKQLNAMSAGLRAELENAVQNFDKDESIGAIVVTGNDKVFAAGADLKEMEGLSYLEASKYTALPFGGVAECMKPVIAAVNGLAFGAGNELIMACDIIYAGEKATFGQPEVAVGVIPGAGGTQRLPRFIGKSKAMEMILTGSPITAQEAEKAGLVSKVFPTDKVVEEAIKLGEKIARHSQVTVSLCKQSVKAAYETTMSEGLKYEKSLFHGAFATNDQKEGMKAFIEKRPAKFTNS